MITDAAIWALVVIVSLNTIFLAGMAVTLFLVRRKLDEGLGQAGPLLAQAEKTLREIETTSVRLQGSMEQMLGRATRTVDRVSDRLETISTAAENAAVEPLIGAASVMAGINQGIRTMVERPGQSAADEADAPAGSADERRKG